MNKPLKSLVMSMALQFELENRKDYDNIVDAMIGAYEAGFNKAWEMQQNAIDKVIKEQFKIN